MAHRSPAPRRKRRSRGLFWLLILVVTAVATAFLSARRREEDEDGREAAGRRAGGPLPEPFPEPEPVPQESFWISGPGGNLHVRDGGSGPGVPILFIHSLAGNGGQWNLQLDELRHGRRAVALDLRGHGESDPADDGDYSIESMADDVAAVADQLELRRFVLAGHSLGSAVAIEYASRHADRVAGLLLVDPNGDQTRVPAEQVAPFLEALRKDPHSELEWYYRQLVVGGDADAARWVLDDLHATHEEAIPKALEESTRYSPLPALARYGGPRLSVVSDMNSLPYSLHKLLPDLPVRLVHGTGHWLMMDRPREFNRLMEEFLEQVETA